MKKVVVEFVYCTYYMANLGSNVIKYISETELYIHLTTLEKCFYGGIGQF